MADDPRRDDNMDPQRSDTGQMGGPQSGQKGGQAQRDSEDSRFGNTDTGRDSTLNDEDM